MNIKKKLAAVFMCLILLIGCIPVNAAVESEEKNGTGELLLATVSDIHYFPASLSLYRGEAFYNYLQGSNCSYDDLSGILDATFAALEADAKEKGLKYVVITGDLTTNGEYEGHVELARRLKAFEEESGLTVFVFGGNHDINNSDASSFVTPDFEKTDAITTSPVDFYHIYHEFGFDDADDRLYDFDSGKAGALSYAVSVEGGYRLIMADAGKYSADNTESGEDEHETAGNMTQEVVDWVLKQAEIAEKNGETPILFTHWNLSEINYMHGEVLQGFVIDEGYRLQEIFADAGIHFAFSGHQHVSDIDITYSDDGEPLYSVITPTLTQFPYQFRETLFTSEKSGKVSADFQQYSVDVEAPVESSEGTLYTSPYYITTGFAKQYIGNSPSEYLLLMLKKNFSGYINQIKADGSIVNFIKNRFDFDIEETIDNLIYGGLVFEGTPVFTTANIMAFINDLDSQIVAAYVDDPEALWSLLRTALEKLTSVQVSEVPCTKFLETYGFGDTLKGGTIGDLFLSAIVYMYVGNEDCSDDLFIQDVLKRAGTVDFVNLIFDSVIEIVVEDTVLNEILANLNVNINTLFGNPSGGTAKFVQGLYEFIAALIQEGFFKSGSLADFTARLKSLTATLKSGKTVSYKYLVESVLATGYVSYGKTVEELAYSLIDKFIPQKAKEGTAYQIQVIADGIFTDDDRDYDVTYIYNGADIVTPSVEDMQLPADVTVTYGNDGTEITFTWYTKYSVTGTDIEIVDANSNLAGIPMSARQADIKTAYAQISGYGFDFGTFGILPWTREVVRHEVTVTGLAPDKEYKFRIGDFDKGFYRDGTFSTASAYNSDFTFVLTSDAADTTPNGYEVFADTLKTAYEDESPAFLLSVGNSVYDGDNYDQWSWFLNGAADTFLNLPVVYTVGDKDIGNNEYENNLFSYPNASAYASTLYGTYRSFDYGTCHFAVLNTNDLDESGTLSYGQTKWLTKDLEASDADWKFLVMHEGIYDTLSDNDALKQQIIQLARDYDIAMVLSGNDAVYARSYVVTGGKTDANSPAILDDVSGEEMLTYVDYDGFISLSAGSVNTDAVKAQKEDLSDFAAVKEESRPVYTAFTVSGETLKVKTYAVNEDGSKELLDSFALCSDIILRRTGDVDLNGTVQAADARLALRYTVGLEKLTDVQKLCADVDSSKSITAADARLILRASVGLTRLLPVYIQYDPNTAEEVKF